MRPAGVLAILALSLASPGQAPIPAGSAEQPRVSRDEIEKIESGFEGKLKGLNDKDPPSVLGACSGIYLNGYGVIFTTALDLITPAYASPFGALPANARPEIVHQRKLAQLPVLRQAMRGMLTGAAKGLTALPANEKIAVAVRLLYFQGEDKTGLPAQIVLTADRAAALAGNITEEP
jgi:hypothetical protein